jgi:hypothetical protein
MHHGPNPTENRDRHRVNKPNVNVTHERGLPGNNDTVLVPGAKEDLPILSKNSSFYGLALV